jgi:hypothetical protein
MTNDIAIENITYKKIRRIIFIYILFNDAVNSSGYMAANGRYSNTF